MKKIFTFLVLVAIVQMSFAQNTRYIDKIFTDVDVQEDVTYAANSSILLLPNTGSMTKVPLYTDVYTPAGDTETNRPLVLVFHTGNFLPPILNRQIAGHKKDSSVVHICTELAKRGFVAAAVTYRSGWNPAAQTQPERALGLIQAAYRGLQDGRAAIRYFRLTEAAAGNPYGIDPDRIAVWGNGTGGYVVLGMTGLSKYSEIPVTTNGPGKFLLDTDGDGVVETPMIVEAYHGDINGIVPTAAPDAAFGIPAGDSTNFAFHTQFSSDFNLCINVGGAIGDISWLDDNTTPIISIQSAFDQFAPYDDDVLVVPTTGDPIVQVQGGLAIARASDAAGLNQAWIDQDFDDPITMKAKANAAAGGHDYIEGLFPIVKAKNSFGVDEGVVMNWWNADDAAPGIGIPGVPSAAEGVPLNMLPFDSTMSFHEQGQILNQGMSAAKSKANIDSIMQYVLPRAFVSLNLDYVGTENLDASVLGLKVSPNPTSNSAIIQTTSREFEEIRVFNLNGQLMKQVRNLNTNSYRLDRGDLPNGMYAVQIQFEEGVITQKLIFN